MNRKDFLRNTIGGAAALTLTPNWGHSSKPQPAIRPGDLDTRSWSAVREQFPLTRDRLYLNTGGLGPPSQPVLDTLCEQTRLQAVRGETYHSKFEEVRQTTAAFMGADATEIAFVRNATEGNSIIAAGLDLKEGDEVIFESHAHPGGSFPWLNRQMRDGIKVRIFEPDNKEPGNNLDRIFSLVNKRTRVIQVSHLTAPTGILFDVTGIAREARKRGIWFHIDGAQSAGMIPVDLHAIECDSYATSGHKWLNGPQESGILYIAKSHIDDVACSHAGAYSDHGYELPDQFSYNPTAQRHEYGTRDAANLLALETALRFQEAIGRERIARHGKQLADLAREKLQFIPGLEILTPAHPAMYNSMLTFRFPDKDGKKLAGQLTQDLSLRCRSVTERDLNAIRLSWHVYHEESDVETVVEGIRSLA